MNSITQILLAGAAFGALTTASAMAEDVPPFHVTALNAGHVVDKTRIHHAGRRHITSTIEISTSILAELDKKVKLAFMYIPCSNSPVKRGRFTKKATYGKAAFSTETYSGGCSNSSNGGFDLYGYTYKLTNPEGEGKTDSFVSSLISKVEYNGVKYKVTVNTEVNVAIGE